MSGRLEFKLSKEEADLYKSFCKANDKSQVAMFRILLGKITGEAISNETKSEELKENLSRKITVRLSELDSKKLTKKAIEEGYENRTKYATSILLSHLKKEPVFTNNEIAALLKSTAQMLAIGRNLNQITKAINIEYRESEKLKKESIEKISSFIQDHISQVKNILGKNMKRWQ